MRRRSGAPQRRRDHSPPTVPCGSPFASLWFPRPEERIAARLRYRDVGRRRIRGGDAASPSARLCFRRFDLEREPEREAAAIPRARRTPRRRRRHLALERRRPRRRRVARRFAISDLRREASRRPRMPATEAPTPRGALEAVARKRDEPSRETVRVPPKRRPSGAGTCRRRGNKAGRGTSRRVRTSPPSARRVLASRRRRLSVPNAVERRNRSTPSSSSGTRRRQNPSTRTDRVLVRVLWVGAP